MAAARRFFIVFGAAVKPDNSPSATLRSRVENAVTHARSISDAVFIVTGAVGRYGPAEADVMRNLLLALGISDEHIIREPLGDDTLSSAIYCARVIDNYAGRAASITVCSSAYHNPRCVWLLRLLNIPAKSAKVPSDRSFLSPSKWLWLCLREPPALVWDTLLLLIYLLTGKTKRAKSAK